MQNRAFPKGHGIGILKKKSCLDFKLFYTKIGSSLIPFSTEFLKQHHAWESMAGSWCVFPKCDSERPSLFCFLPSFSVTIWHSRHRLIMNSKLSNSVLLSKHRLRLWERKKNFVERKILGNTGNVLVCSGSLPPVFSFLCNAYK